MQLWLPQSSCWNLLTAEFAVSCSRPPVLTFNVLSGQDTKKKKKTEWIRVIKTYVQLFPITALLQLIQACRARSAPTNVNPNMLHFKYVIINPKEKQKTSPNKFKTMCHTTMDPNEGRKCVLYKSQVWIFLACCMNQGLTQFYEHMTSLPGGENSFWKLCFPKHTAFPKENMVKNTEPEIEIHGRPPKKSTPSRTPRGKLVYFLISLC